eukprot:3122178-Amphidinium_carterae.1
MESGNRSLFCMTQSPHRRKETESRCCASRSARPRKLQPWQASKVIGRGYRLKKRQSLRLKNQRAKLIWHVRFGLGRQHVMVHHKIGPLILTAACRDG